jgi:hypothetical protein
MLRHLISYLISYLISHLIGVQNDPNPRNDTYKLLRYKRRIQHKVSVLVEWATLITCLAEDGVRRPQPAVGVRN